jgi:type VI secretion system protein ImpA
MAIPPVISLDEVLEPISGDRPSGVSLAYDAEYDALRTARRSDDGAPQGDWRRDTKSAEWGRVVGLGTDLLKKRSKDLQIAAWVAEALTRTHGFAGLRDGLRLLLGIQERFWDSFHPEIEDGDLESRHGPYVFLNGTLPLVIRGIAMTSGYGEEAYSYLRWEESRATDNAGLKSPDLMEALIAEGKITSKQFDEQVGQTPRRFYEDLVQSLDEALAAYQDLDRAVDARFGRDAPGLGNIRKALDDCRRAMEPIIRTKRAEEPDDNDFHIAPQAAEEPAPEDSAEASVEGLSTPSPRTRPATRSATGPIASAEDAAARIAEAAAYLRTNAPSSATGRLVVRALQMGDLFGPYAAPPSESTAPPSATRQALRKLAADADWTNLLDESERSLARPEGRAWLDPHRYAVTALRSIGDYDGASAAAAVVGFLRFILGAFPDMTDAELSDGTPTANAETRAWIREEVVPPSVEAAATGPDAVWSPPAYESPPSVEVDGDATPDAWDEAIAAVRAGRVGDGFERLRQAVKAAATGRDRFLRKLQMAELCLTAGNPRLALPLAEDLAKQVDEYRLEEWEDERLSARVWAALYRCLNDAAGSADAARAERARQAFARLCRLDVGQALGFSDGRPPG